MNELWRVYEDAARAVLAHIGKQYGIAFVEPKQKIPGNSGTEWEIDAKAVLDAPDKFLILEARRYTTSGVNQEAMAAIAFRINDTNAAGAVVVSPLPLQLGAKKVAAYANIEHLRLAADSTAVDYLAEYMGKRYTGASMNSTGIVSDFIEATVIKKA